jgi:hypothetical protein
MRAIAGGYSKAPRNDTEDYLTLTPTRNINKAGENTDPMDRFRRYEEVCFLHSLINCNCSVRNF